MLRSRVIGATPGGHTLWYRDTMSPDASGKPVGATHLQLFVALGDGPPVGGANDARWIGHYTRNPIGVTFSPQDEGKRATYDS